MKSFLLTSRRHSLYTEPGLGLREGADHQRRALEIAHLAFAERHN